MESIGRTNIPGKLAIVSRSIQHLDAVPYSALAIPLRLAIAVIFWNSAMTKLDDWNAVLFLFREEYRLAILPPEIAAQAALVVELSMPVLLVLGFFTRGAALVLLAMTTVIEVFVYPQAWPTHLQWAAMLLVLLCRGGGRISLDSMLNGYFARRGSGTIA